MPQPWEEIVPPITGKPGSGCEFFGNVGTGIGSDPSGAPTIKCLEGVFANVVSVVVELAGFAFFVMFVIGAIKYLTSGGDPKATESAQKTISSALLGLVLIIGSFLILKLIETFTGVSLMHFTIPFF